MSRSIAQIRENELPTARTARLRSLPRAATLLIAGALSLHALALASPAHAASPQDPAPRIVGAWKLKDFVIRTAQGKEDAFCPGMNGSLAYELSGYVSVAINCAPGQTTGTPAEAYGGQLFYAGRYEIHGHDVVHKLAQASVPALIGQSLTRRVEKLTDTELVLTGKLGSKGDTLRIVWTRPDPTTAATDESFSLFTFIRVKPGMEKRFAEEVATIVSFSRSEPGNIAWFVQQSKEDPSEFIFFTRWLNEEALQYHLSAEPLASYIERTRELQAEGSLRLVRFTPLDRP